MLTQRFPSVVSPFLVAAGARHLAYDSAIDHIAFLSPEQKTKVVRTYR
jgi:hypothetical protein